MSRAQLKSLAQEIISVMKQHGIVVHMYEAYSTSSIYLKLDYGVANSIRISDHVGKKHLSYRFNLGLNIKSSYEAFDKYPRYYYCVADLGKMIEDILAARKEKIDTYGEDRYKQFMQQNADSRHTQKGFWTQAKRV